MKYKEQLSHQEIMDGLTACFRELISTEVSHRNMPNIINRGKAAAAIVTAAHREEIMEAKRTGTGMALQSAQESKVKQLQKKAS